MNMKIIKKTFDDLTTRELFEIYKIRVDVFVVEQECPYPEVDEIDLEAWHVWLESENGIEAYARVFEKEEKRAAIGRVLAKTRRAGYGTRVVKEAIHTAKEVFGAEKIYLEAQIYAKSLYEKLGFVQISEEFLEDGIPHIGMELV